MHRFIQNVIEYFYATECNKLAYFFPVPHPAEVAQAAWVHLGLSVALLSFLLLLFCHFFPVHLEGKWTWNNTQKLLKPAKQRALKHLRHSQILCTVKGLKTFVKQKQRHIIHAPVPTFQKVRITWCLGLRTLKENTLEWGKGWEQGKGEGNFKLRHRCFLHKPCSQVGPGSSSASSCGLLFHRSCVLQQVLRSSFPI